MASTDLCPHLGVPGAQQMRYGYPSGLNVCYAGEAGPLAFLPVELAYQKQVCLTGEHEECSTYLSAAAHALHYGRAVPANRHLPFFGLKEEPFSVVPQPRFLAESEQQREAHTGLRWLVDCHHGLGLLLGAVGSGKTVLCRALFEDLSSDRQYIPALVLTPSYRSEYALMSDLLAEWRLGPQHVHSTRSQEAVVHDFLLQTVLGRKRTAVLIIDEAQSLSSRLLQQVCTLLNWQDQGQQLLQVILAGQPGLQSSLDRVPALRDRVVVEYALTALTRSETQRLIFERLTRAGATTELFTVGAIELIHRQTRGMPRRIVILCLKSLWLAYYDGQPRVTADVVQAVMAEAKGGDLFALPEVQPTNTVGVETAGPHRTHGAVLRRLLRQFRRRSED